MPDTTLWCLVGRGGIPFSVSASPALTIDELKTKINETNKNNPHFQRVDAFNLMLWKPRDIIPVMPSNTLAQRLSDLGLRLSFSQIAEVLDPAATIARSFQSQDPTSPLLNVIVPKFLLRVSGKT